MIAIICLFVGFIFGVSAMCILSLDRENKRDRVIRELRREVDSYRAMAYKRNPEQLN
jgi:hypothetical protein